MSLVAEVTIRTRAEKKFQKMAKSEKGGDKSLFSNSARNFVVAIPLLSRERPVPMGPEFKRAARSEYPVRYLEEVGATPTKENIALVEKHMGIERECKAQAAWKSRGSVADYLYLSPNWADPGNKGKAVTRVSKKTKGIMKDLKTRMNYDVFDYSVIDSTLMSLEEKRKDKIKAQQPHRKPLSSSEKYCTPALAATMILLEEHFGLNDSEDAVLQVQSSEGGVQQLRLRRSTFQGIRDELYAIDSLTVQAERMQRVEKLQRTRKKQAKEQAHVRSQRKSSERHEKNLFNSTQQVFPRRVFVPLQGLHVVEPKQTNVPDISKVFTKDAELELSQSIVEHVSREKATIAKLIKSVLETVPPGLLVSANRAIVHLVSEDTVQLVQLAAQYTFKACILSPLEKRGYSVALAKLLSRKQSATEKRFSARRRSVFPHDTSEDGGGRRSSKTVDQLDSFKSKTQQPSHMEEDMVSKEELLRQFSAKYAMVRDQLMEKSQLAMKEDLPCLLLLVRSLVDAFFCSFYPRTMACLLLQEEGSSTCMPETDEFAQEQQRRQRQLREQVVNKEPIHRLRRQYDETVCSVMDPGFFLRRSFILTPPRQKALSSPQTCGKSVTSTKNLKP